MAKISDVAALAQVSVGLVSRVLSQDPTLRVSESTRARVIAAATELAYVPSHAARALRTSRSGALALVVPDVTSAVFAELARGAEDAAAEHGVSIMLASADRVQADPGWLRAMVGAGRVDGVILQLPDGVALTRIVAMVTEPVPIVLINSVAEGDITSVVLDDAEGVRVAVAHLRELGHHELGFVGGTRDSFTGVRRLAGFSAATAEFGLTARPEHVLAAGYSGAEGRAAAGRLLTAGQLPTALVVANLNAALGLLAEFHAHGVRLPEDVSIVAIHDVWYADATWPPITTVRMPLRELGAAAVSRVLEYSDATATRHDVISYPKPALLRRASTAPPKGA